jgi:Domain of unknown function (DUF4124)
MRRRHSLFALLLGVVLGAVAAPTLATTLYKWVDEHGVTHYSDTPVPGAERLQVVGAQSFHATPATGGGAQPAAPKNDVRDGYTRVEIVSPQDGAVFINEGGNVDVTAAIEPPLITGHQVWFVVDGSRLDGLPPMATSASLDLPRGTHNVSVTVTDATGHEVANSPGVSFTIRERSIAAPPRGPALTPPAPPAPPPKHP